MFLFFPLFVWNTFIVLFYQVYTDVEGYSLQRNYLFFFRIIRVVFCP